MDPPSPPRRRKVLTSTERADYREKQNCLETLMDHPRANHPEIRRKLESLDHTLNELIVLGRTSYTPLLRRLLENYMADIKSLENVVIRFVHSEKSLAEVYEDIRKSSS